MPHRKPRGLKHRIISRLILLYSAHFWRPYYEGISDRKTFMHKIENVNAELSIDARVLKNLPFYDDVEQFEQSLIPYFSYIQK